MGRNLMACGVKCDTGTCRDDRKDLGNEGPGAGWKTSACQKLSAAITGSKFASLRIQHAQADPVIEPFRFPALDRGTANEAGFSSIYDHDGSSRNGFFRLDHHFKFANFDSATAHVALSVV